MFLVATHAPESVREVITHADMSQTSVIKMLKSIAAECFENLKELGRNQLAAIGYDNLEFKLAVAQTTLARQSTFESIATGIIWEMKYVEPDDLKWTRQLWESSIQNESRPEGAVIQKRPTYINVHPSLAVINSVQNAMEWHILAAIVRTKFPEYEDKLGRPANRLQIPVGKNSPLPAKAMRAKVSSNDGNLEALIDLLLQAGIDRKKAELFVTICSGDLGVLERVESVKEYRRIESDFYETLQFVITIPGLFHVKMAAADAMFRTYCEPKAFHESPGSVYELFKMLNLKEHHKLSKNPPFRMMHDGIEMILKAALLELWEKWCGAKSLDVFAEGEPSFETLRTLAAKIVKSTAFGLDMERLQSRADKDRDVRWENSAICIRDFLLYEILSDSMNHGEIGLVEDVLWMWIPLFKSCKKHKYSAHLLRFLHRLRDIYPEALANAIRLNWLCNPRGNRDTFRAIDWFVEWYNLYHKVSTLS